MSSSLDDPPFHVSAADIVWKSTATIDCNRLNYHGLCINLTCIVRCYSAPLPMPPRLARYFAPNGLFAAAAASITPS